MDGESVFEKRASGLLVPRHKLAIGGHFHGKILRPHRKNGKLILIDEFDCHNLVVNQGLDHILGVEFTSVAQITSWFMAPFTNNYVPVATDTAATIPGNAGEATGYTASTRVAYTAVESTQEVTNSASPAAFTFNADLTIYGAFLISSSTKSSTSGTLFAAAQFGSAKSVESGDQLQLTYSFSAQSS